MTRTTTTVREYDSQGRMVKETRTEVVSEQVSQPYRVGDGTWWQNPVVSFTSGSSTEKMGPAINKAMHRNHTHSAMYV